MLRSLGCVFGLVAFWTSEAKEAPAFTRFVLLFAPAGLWAVVGNRRWKYTRSASPRECFAGGFRRSGVGVELGREIGEEEVSAVWMPFRGKRMGRWFRYETIRG